MIASFLSFVLFASVLASASIAVPYTGYRISLNKDLMKGSYYEIFEASLSYLREGKWPDLKKQIGEGFLSFGFNVDKVSYSSGHFDPAKASVNNFEVKDKKIHLSITGDALSINFDFNYDFIVMGMHIFFGKGTFAVTSKQITLEQKMTADFFETGLNVEFVPKVVQISGFDLFGGINRWIVYMINEILLKDKDTMLQIQTAVHKGTTEYFKKWIIIKTPFYDDGSLNMILKSYIETLTTTSDGYVSFGYDTRVTVDDRPYDKMVWKIHITEPKISEGSRAQVCVASSLISSMVEVRSKARDFLFRIEPKDIGLEGKITDLYNIMPKLEDMFPYTEDITIGCKPNGENSIVIINDKDFTDENVRLQIPVNCVIGTMPTGKLLLSVNFVLRANAIIKHNSKEGLVSINGEVSNLALYNFKTDYEFVGVESHWAVGVMVEKIGKLLEGFEFLPRGLVIPLPFAPKDSKVTITKDEYCFDYQ